MKKLWIIGLVVALLAVCAVDATAAAADVRLLGIAERAGHAGATHEFTVKYSDFTTAATNTAETLTFAVTAGQGFHVVYADVITEFVGAAGTDSLTVVVGDGTDADQYLTSLELATESTELVGKFGTTWADGVFYEVDDTVDITFTPNAENATDDFTAGEIKIYGILIE